MPSGIRVMVVDDEPLARRSLVILLEQDPQIGLVVECSGGAHALAAIPRDAPDLLFLDVEMPERDGFDVLEMLGSAAPPAIVFVTAFDRYAIRAFEAGALDYLLKPFDDERFRLALERAKLRIAQHRLQPQTRRTITVKNAGSIVFVEHAQIDWIEAADYYSRLHVGSTSHLLRRSMTELERELDDATFCRIHRSTIVRLAKICRLDLNENGEYDVVLEDGTRLPSSRRYRKRLQSPLVSNEDLGRARCRERAKGDLVGRERFRDP